MVKFQKGGNNIFTVVLNDVVVGTVESRDEAYKALRMARKAISTSTEELTLATANIAIKGDNVLWGEVESAASVAGRMVDVLSGSKKSTLNRAYSIKINEFSVNLASIDEVMTLLKNSIAKYDTENQYDVHLVLDPSREVNVLMPQVLSKEEVQKVEEIAKTSMPEAGFFATVTDVVNAATPLA